MQRRAGHLGRVDDTGLDEVDDLAGGGVETISTLGLLDGLDHDGTLETGILRDLAQGGLKRVGHDASTSGLITLKVADELDDCGASPNQSGSSAGDNALIDGCTSCAQGILDAVLLLLEFHLGGCTDLDDGHAASKLGKALLELLAVPVGVSVLDLSLDLGDPAGNGLRGARSLDDRGGVLGHDDPTGRTQQVERGGLKLEADLLGDDLGASQDGHVLQHGLAALTEARSLDGHRVEGATDLVHDQRGESLALDVLGDDQQWATRLHHLLEHRHKIRDGRDLRVHEHDERLVEDGLLALLVRDEVGREVALVELHALRKLKLEAEGVGLLDGHSAVLAHLVDGIGKDFADQGVRSGDGCDLSDLFLPADDLGLLGDISNGHGHGLVDAPLEASGAGPGGHVAQTLLDQGLGEHGRSGGSVTSDVVGLGGHLLNELGTHVLERVIKLDLSGDGHTVVGDGRGAEGLPDHHVAALRAEGHLDGVSQLVYAGLEAASCGVVELQNLGHLFFFLLGGLGSVTTLPPA